MTTYYYEKADKGLLSTFSERWHMETDMFHLPMGKMTITLDDVSSLLHIPFIRCFCSFQHMEKDVASPLLEELLRVGKKRMRLKRQTKQEMYMSILVGHEISMPRGVI